MHIVVILLAKIFDFFFFLHLIDYDCPPEIIGVRSKNQTPYRVSNTFFGSLPIGWREEVEIMETLTVFFMVFFGIAFFWSFGCSVAIAERVPEEHEGHPFVWIPEVGIGWNTMMLFVSAPWISLSGWILWAGMIVSCILLLAMTLSLYKYDNGKSHKKPPTGVRSL